MSLILGSESAKRLSARIELPALRKLGLDFKIAKNLFLSLFQYEKDPNEMTDDPLLPVLNCVSTRLRTHSEEQKTKKIAGLECASAQPRAPREPRRLAGLLQAADEMVFSGDILTPRIPVTPWDCGCLKSNSVGTKPTIARSAPQGDSSRHESERYRSGHFCLLKRSASSHNGS